MTSTTGQNPHPEVMEISDLAEGILPEDRVAAVRAHVESCEECGEVLASLQEIRGLLGALPEPEPMPADVAARIDAALAAEARLDSALPRVPRETSIPAQDAGDSARVPRGTSAPAGRPSAPTGPGRGRRQRRALLIGAASAAAVLALGGAVYELASSGSTRSMSSADSAQRKTNSQDGGENSGSSSVVASEVARLLGRAGGKTGPGGVTSPMLSTNGDARIAAPDGTVAFVPACVLRATGRTQPPLAADREPFQGTDSYLVVLPDPNDSHRVDAYVVTASCTADVTGSVLFQDSFPRS
ncbi:anti-sigma factor family protein [Streptomyces sp. NBC_01477]|uniref:anti-sigma factor family protein n=1 Tax=Streptomyces sp. NBC_01477 TaxID=2976015 RepID=UPI002E2EEE1C|nr:zf-HC2 domain-containing protein [Streptomyces sp. NBC_01477]